MNSLKAVGKIILDINQILIIIKFQKMNLKKLLLEKEVLVK
jgi:hypothetical protein